MRQAPVIGLDLSPSRHRDDAVLREPGGVHRIHFLRPMGHPNSSAANESQPANPLAKLASRPKTASKLDLYLTKLYLCPRELSNAVSIVTWL